MRAEEPFPDIAVLGAGCRLPGNVHSLEELWNCLLEGKSTVRHNEDAEWRISRQISKRTPNGYSISSAGSATPYHGSSLEHADCFDPLFFGISPREAEYIDPQHRLVLEVCWRALEHANQPATAMAGSATGVFVGLGTDDYAALAAAAGTDRLDTYSLVGVNRAAAAGRVAYLLRTNGPAMVIDTTCSSSLVALHTAAASLRTGESDLAVVAGCQLVRTRWSVAARVRLNALSPGGLCRPFDADADGYVLGEGAVAVVLKRLDEAVADDDPILGVIHGSAVNHDGPSNGLTAPNGRAQQAVIRSALRAARLPASAIGYVEAHGTGTPLGDPIEAEALGAAYAADREQPLVIGSNKPNFGHLEAAAGLLSLLKALMTVNTGEIAPTVGYRRPNRHLDMAALGLRVADRRSAWNVAGTRLAGVSAFGLSGTNCHVIVGGPPAGRGAAGGRPAEPDRTARRHGPVGAGAEAAGLLVLSAKDRDSLNELAGQFAELCLDPQIDFADLCASAATGRSVFRHRLAVNAGTAAEAARLLHAFAQGTAAGTAGPMLAGAVPARFPANPLVLVLPEQRSAASRAGSSGTGEALEQSATQLMACGVPVGVIVAAAGTEPTARRIAKRFGTRLAVADSAEGMSKLVLAELTPTELAPAGLAPTATGTTPSRQTPVVVTVDVDDEPHTGLADLLGGEALVLPARCGGVVDQNGVDQNGVDRAAGLLEVLGALFVLGYHPNWSAIMSGRRTVRLPGHPFRRRRHRLTDIVDTADPGDRFDNGR